jgi:SPP1 gp7 family putative phage head morphogenesis protein
MFSMSNPRVLEYLGIRTAKFGIYVTETISKDITAQLKLAYDAGESIPQIAARIENVFDAAENRATMIARTEMVACSNEGALESYRQSGVVQQKQWLAALDERTRESHMMANGDIVDLEDDFKVGYSSGPCPGSIGDPAEDCNCRCSVAPVVRPDSPLHEVH